MLQEQMLWGRRPADSTVDLYIAYSIHAAWNKSKYLMHDYGFL